MLKRSHSSCYYESVPDDENGSGGFVVSGSIDHSNFSGLPGLQQQTQDTSSCYVLLILTCLHTNTQEEEKKKCLESNIGKTGAQQQ